MTVAIEIVPGTLVFPDLVTGVTSAPPFVGDKTRWHARITVHSVGGGFIMVSGEASHLSADDANRESERWAREVAARVLPYRSGITVAP